MQVSDNTSKVIEVDINEILPNRFQPRRQFDEDEILELSDSIREHGIIQPIVVRTVGDKYEIIAGERRYKASVLAGLETVPVIVKNLNDKDSAEVALIENIQRKNLTPIEEALSYKQILDMGYLTQENLAAKLGKSQSSVANKIRLLNLSDEVQEALLESKISERHARSLLRLQGEEAQNKMLDRIINERLTVRKTDEEIDKIKNGLNNSLKEEKEEESMNNNNMMQTQNAQPSFNFFGGSTPNQTNQPNTQSFDTFFNKDITNINNQSGTATPLQGQEVSLQPSNDILSNSLNNTWQPSQQINTQPNINTQFENNSSIDFGNFQPIMDQNNNGINNLNEQIPNVGAQNNIFGMSDSATLKPQSNEGTSSFNLFPNNMENLNNLNTPAQPTFEMPSFNEFQNINPQTVEMPKINPELIQNNSGFTQMNIPPLEPQNNNFQDTSTSQNNGVQFDDNGMIFDNNQNNQIPQTTPIIEKNDLNLTQPSVDQNLNVPMQPEIKEPQVLDQQVSQLEQTKVPEPIIITDYSKQYDPVMPNAPQEIQPKVPFKVIINEMREFASKIEQYGYKINLEEYDLTTIYQVVIKIEK